MGAPEPKPKLTTAEYLAAERTAALKSEYYRGEVFAMAGGGHDHALIASNLLALLKPSLRERGCQVIGSDLRVATGHDELYTYPDVVIYCGAPQFADERKDTLLNASCIIEVLSPSTRDYDRQGKFQLYRLIATLSEYVTVDSTRSWVERWVKRDRWVLEHESGHGGISISGIQLELDAIYTGVTFAP